MAYNSKAGNYLPSSIAQMLATSTPLPVGTAGVTITNRDYIARWHFAQR
jgi:hypothetical protein